MLENPIEELIRLTMLCLLTSTWKTPGRKLPFRRVNEQLRDTYREIADELTKLDQSLRMWVIVTAAFTVTPAKEDWVREAWFKIDSSMPWADIKAHLMRVMWIETVHDIPGEAAVRKLKEMKLLQ